jgi:hypothetical protein
MATFSPMLSENGVFAQHRRERGHRRTACNNDQVARLQARRHAVEVDEARRHARDFTLIVATVELVNALHHLRQQRLDGNPALGAAGALLGDGEDLGLGLVEHFLDLFALRIERVAGNFIGHRDQFAQHATVAHDLGVAADVGRRRRVLRHGVQVLQAAHFLGLAQGRERFVDGRSGRSHPHA